LNVYLSTDSGEHAISGAERNGRDNQLVQRTLGTAWYIFVYEWDHELADEWRSHWTSLV